MKLVFEKFESSLEMTKGSVNVLCFEDKQLFSNCVFSVLNYFSGGCPEPAVLFNEGKEQKAKDVLLIVGDPASYSLNDKALQSAALKRMSQLFVEDEFVRSNAQKFNAELSYIVQELFLQLNGNYDMPDEWEIQKYLKSLGFCIDESNINNIFDKLMLLLNVLADLLPNKVIVFINLLTYLTEQQLLSFLEQVKALNLIVLSYEVSNPAFQLHVDNGIYIDANFLEQHLSPKQTVLYSKDFAPFEVLEQRHFG